MKLQCTRIIVQVTEFQVSAEDVYKRTRKKVEDLQEEVEALNIQREEVVILN